ncbi:unnamed protein product [Amoebophrya sp. A25]|nr:unnamed protein product [Amoebophrya sp. A25]|eukprot:GSA25T00010774001.1
MQRLASFLPPACANFFPKTGKTVGIIGGGAAGMLAAERLRHLFDVTVIDPKSYYEYSPGMCRAFVQPFSAHKRITFDYRRILEDALGVEFMRGYVESLVDRAGEATGSTPASNAEPAGAPENGGPCRVILLSECLVISVKTAKA